MNCWTSWGPADYAKVPVGQLSGGEQQRLRIAQALATDPKVLLCDEPLLSLDLHHQQAVSALINKQCHEQKSAVVFVTHEINPIIDYVDRVLYLAGGRFSVGTPHEVMTTEVLSELYDSHVEVIHANGRIVVVGLPDATTPPSRRCHAAAGRGRLMDPEGILQSVFNFENYGELLVLVQNSLWAGAVLGLLGGLVGTFVMKRDLAFAVHGISELSFAGAAFALLIGADVVFGSLIGSVAAALLLGLMGVRATGQELHHRRDHAVRAGPRHPVPVPLRRPRRQQVRPADRADRLGGHGAAAGSGRHRGGGHGCALSPSGGR